MNKNYRDHAGRVRRSLFAFAFFAVLLSLAAVAPFVTRAALNRTDDTKRDAKSKITYPETKKVEVVYD
jgi:hypothetical protein